jgi:hypothetical protein
MKYFIIRICILYLWLWMFMKYFIIFAYFMYDCGCLWNISQYLHTLCMIVDVYEIFHSICILYVWLWMFMKYFTIFAYFYVWLWMFMKYFITFAFFVYGFKFLEKKKQIKCFWECRNENITVLHIKVPTSFYCQGCELARVIPLPSLCACIGMSWGDLYPYTVRYMKWVWDICSEVTGFVLFSLHM